MTTPLDQLRAWREDLWRVRAAGLRECRDATGESVSYRSDRELAAAIAAVDTEIAKMTGANWPRFLPLTFSKGL